MNTIKVSMAAAALCVAAALFLFACDSAPPQNAQGTYDQTASHARLSKTVSADTDVKSKTKPNSAGSHAADSNPKILKIPTDSPAVAIRNLRSAIKAKSAQLKQGKITAKAGWELVQHHLTLARYLGSTQAFRDAQSAAQTLMSSSSQNPEYMLIQVDVLVALHKFSAALKLLDKALSAGASAQKVEDARLVLLLAQGQLEKVVKVREANAKKYGMWKHWARLGITLAAAGRYGEADQAYERAMQKYRGTSPFVVSWLLFARGVMWAEEAGDTHRGRRFYEAAVRHLPQYLVANIHLAELESESGQLEQAIARLESLVADDSDPELYAKLSSFYAQRGDTEKSAQSLARAKAIYNDLLAQFPEAWADHGTEFFMGPGADPKRAFTLAKINLASRETPRAHALFLESAMGAGQTASACKLASTLTKNTHPHLRLREALADTKLKCAARQ